MDKVIGIEIRPRVLSGITIGFIRQRTLRLYPLYSLSPDSCKRLTRVLRDHCDLYSTQVTLHGVFTEYVTNDYKIKLER